MTNILQIWKSHRWRTDKEFAKNMVRMEMTSNMMVGRQVRNCTPEIKALGKKFQQAIKEYQYDTAGGLLMTIRYVSSNPTGNLSKPLEHMPTFYERKAVVDGLLERWKMGIVWHGAEWYKFDAHPGHFLHVSEIDPTMLAYYEVPKKFFKGTPVRIRPGRYLAKYYPHLSAQQIKEYGMQQQSFAQSNIGALHFIEHNDPTGWVRIYKEAPRSCMRGSDSVRVYAHDKSVLRLAYWAEFGKILARCIVREDTKPPQWIRVYPDPEAEKDGTILRDALTKAGYVRGSMEGVLLRLIAANADNDEWICPYIDKGTQSVNVDIRSHEGKRYLLLSHTLDWCSDRTDGICRLNSRDDEGEDDEEEDNYYSCEQCGDSHDQADMYSYEDYMYCENCYSDLVVHAFTSHVNLRTQEDRLRDDCVEVRIGRRNQWFFNSSRVLSAHGIDECCECGHAFHIDYLYGVEEGLACDDCTFDLDHEYNDDHRALKDNTIDHTIYGRVHKNWEPPEPEPELELEPVPTEHWPFPHKKEPQHA